MTSVLCLFHFNVIVQLFGKIIVDFKYRGDEGIQNLSWTIHKCKFFDCLDTLYMLVMLQSEYNVNCLMIITASSLKKSG